MINQFLAKGWAFIASDYQGEGTPGIIPYIVGGSAAKDTINLVRPRPKSRARTRPRRGSTGVTPRAARPPCSSTTSASPTARASPEGRRRRRTPLTAQPLDGFLKSSPYAFYILMVAFGFHAYYGSTAPLDT